MWWDWTQITWLDSVLFSITALFTLFLVGLGSTKLFCRLTKTGSHLEGMDFFQKVNFNIFFGLISVMFFILVFAFFNTPFWFSTFAIIAIAALGLIISRPHFCWRPKKTDLQKYAGAAAVFLVLFSVMFVLSTQIEGFYGSTNDDASYHTLVTRTLIDYPDALITRSPKPYADYPLDYPTGAHVLCAFLVTSLGVQIQKIVILISVLIPVLIALSIYSTLKCLFDHQTLAIIGLIVGSFFGLSFFWLPVGWGGLPLLLSLYISISSMGLIFELLHKNPVTPAAAIAVGFSFFVAIQTYPVALLMVGFWFLIVVAAEVISQKYQRTKMSLSFKMFSQKKNLYTIICFLLPLLMCLPYFAFVFIQHDAYFQSPTLNPVATTSSEILKTRLDFNWLFNLHELSNFFSAFGNLLALAPLAFVPLVGSFFSLFSQKIKSVLPPKFVYSLILIVILFFAVMSYLALTVYVPLTVFSNFIDPQRTWAHLIIPATMLTGVFLFFCFNLIYRGCRVLNRKMHAKLLKIAVFGVVLLVLTYSVSFLAVTPVEDETARFSQIRSSFIWYNTLEADDLTLMSWLNDNTPTDSVILISSGDSGQYISSVTQRQTASMYHALGNYTAFMVPFTADASDLQTVPFLLENNVSYVYIGSVASTFALNNPKYNHFNVTQLLSTPYFSMTKQVGDAYLLQFNATAALNVYNQHVDNQ